MSFAVFHMIARYRRYSTLAAFFFILPGGIGYATDQLPGYVVVPITLVADANQAIVRVTANGQSTSLMLDTGASSTFLDSRFYKGASAKASGETESKLPPEFQHRTLQANGEKVEIGYVASLKCGAMNFGGGPVAVADLSGQLGRYNSRHPEATIGGLLGEDILRKYAAIIDWRRRGVYFNTDPAKRLKLGPGLTGAGWTAVPLSTTNANHFAVACTIEEKPVRLVVDTGATFTSFDKDAISLHHMMYNRDTRNSIGHLAINQMHSSMFGMDSTAYMARIENWKIGNYTVPHSVVMSHAMPPGLVTHNSGGDGPIVGLLGAEVLAGNNAIIDVAGATLYLKPSAVARSSTR